MKYADLDTTEQPRNRIREYGGGVLVTAELLSIALQIGNKDTAEELAALLFKYGHLNKIPQDEIISIKGLSAGYVDAIAAIAELVNRETSSTRDPLPTVHGSRDIAQWVMYEMSGFDHEELWVMLLDSQNQVIKIDKTYKGTANSCTVRVGELFRAAIVEQAVSIVLIHNHPSGDTGPSHEDILLTRLVAEAGLCLDIRVLDHVIVGGNKYTSLKDKGVSFEQRV